MLATYLSQVRRLLQNPSAPVSLYSDADLTPAINEGRVQVAAEGAAIRVQGTLGLTSGNAGPYSISTIDTSATTGVAGPLDVRALWYTSGSGRVWIAPRSFDWFTVYNLNVISPISGPPSEWAQYARGVSATLFISPPPNAIYSLLADCICYPIPLVDDSTAEAIPPLWQTAVQYYGAYLALLSAQTGARSQEADKMLERYELFTQRARKLTTPDVLPLQYADTIPEPRATQYEPPRQQAGGGG